ncbi:MAG: DUF1840 family protein [Leptothrix ochracea]|uniref:DUF1840 family protein n=1 Tax=Leptothrix ochracea TaxID=735331 RepID=UPI0034E2D283
MIYKFKSQADADVIMLEPNGEHMLALMGREPSAQGVVTVAQMPAAIAALEAAILAQEGDEHARLRARAEPFIHLLSNSAKAGKDVVWGV